MSRFFSERYAALEPYVPGEQPQDRLYIKLNTNESPFAPAPGVAAAVAQAAERVQLYSDPECRALRHVAAAAFGVQPENVVMTNGSDEVLYFAFAAFANEAHPLAFPDITYGFYPVFAQINRIPYREIPLDEGFRINLQDYLGTGETVVIANPNAPTGIALGLAEIERIVASNPNRVVIVDEAYVDFGGESAIPLTARYENLLVTGTFSKSRNLAGARLGFGIGNAALIADINTLRYSFNPYNVNSLTAAAGIAALGDVEYFQQCVASIRETREWTVAQLQARGFKVLPSCTNFVFATHPCLEGGETYRKLKEQGILVRHFDKPRLGAYNRITIGTRAQMEALLAAMDTMLE